ncbi:MAG: hypothetical protein IPJ65_26735 [Archangiaceae bacterium]|nr:hypothetical protein [Archangiaceae bacterium]
MRSSEKKPAARERLRTAAAPAPVQTPAAPRAAPAAPPAAPFQTTRSRADQARALVEARPVAGHTPHDAALQAMPAELRRLAHEVDSLWGNSDGKVQSAELERVLGYVSAALPFFGAEAKALGELAKLLKLEVAVPEPLPRSATAAVDAQARGAFDAAIQVAERQGDGGLLRDVLAHSPKWHSLSILEHSAFAVEAARRLCADTGVSWPEAGATLLLHDAGKILTRHHNPDGSFSFVGHDHVAADFLTTRVDSEELLFQIRHHMEIHALTPDQALELAGGDRQRLARMLIVLVSDHVAEGTPDERASFAADRPHLLALAEAAGIDGERLLATAEQVRAEVAVQAARIQAARPR